MRRVTYLYGPVTVHATDGVLSIGCPWARSEQLTYLARRRPVQLRSYLGSSEGEQAVGNRYIGRYGLLGLENARPSHFGAGLRYAVSCHGRLTPGALSKWQ
jgi:hypothetical protein